MVYSRVKEDAKCFVELLNAYQVDTTLGDATRKRIQRLLLTYVHHPVFVRSVFIAELVKRINENTSQWWQRKREETNEAVARRVLLQNNLLGYLGMTVAIMESPDIAIDMIDTANGKLVQRSYRFGKHYRMKYSKWSGYSGMHLESVDKRHHYLLFSCTTSPLAAHPSQGPFSMMVDAVYDIGWLLRSQKEMREFLSDIGVFEATEASPVTLRTVGVSLGGTVARDTVDLANQIVSEEVGAASLNASYISLGAPGRIGNWHYFFPHALMLCAALSMGVLLALSVCSTAMAVCCAASIMGFGALFYVLDPFGMFYKSIENNHKVPSVVLTAQNGSRALGELFPAIFSHPVRLNPLSAAPSGGYYGQIEWDIADKTRMACPHDLFSKGYVLRQRFANNSVGSSYGESLISDLGVHDARHSHEIGWLNRLKTFFFVVLMQPLLLVVGAVGVLCASLMVMCKRAWSQNKSYASKKVASSDALCFANPKVQSVGGLGFRGVASNQKRYRKPLAYSLFVEHMCQQEGWNRSAAEQAANSYFSSQKK